MNRLRFFPYSSKIESKINENILLFSLIVIFQGTLGASAFKSPELFKKLSNHYIFNFIGLIAIAYTASQDIEISFISVMIYLLIMKLIKLYEEKKRF